MKVPNISAPDVRAASDHSVLITFGNSISRELHREVRRAFDLLLAHSISGITNLHPAYASILISFDPRRLKAEILIETVRSLLKTGKPLPPPTETVVDIPVCYDEEFAPDLSDVASLHNLSVDEVVRKHSSVEYLVYFLGFSPGFPYLGNLPDDLATPRLPTPRVKVPAGSVAIGGEQTGIYPMDSPGGWRVIGRTPRRIFFPEKNPPTLLYTGALVRFVPIHRNEFQAILKQEDR